MTLLLGTVRVRRGRNGPIAIANVMGGKALVRDFLPHWLVMTCGNAVQRLLLRRWCHSDILSEQAGAVDDTMSMFSTLFAVLKTRDERC